MIKTTEHLEEYSVIKGVLASSQDNGMNGAFVLPLPTGHFCSVVVSNEGDWEHVSVSLPHRTPTWKEMCFIKDAFWYPDEAVMQLHPPKEDHINNHEYCLHLWRPLKADIPLPPSIYVGLKSLNKKAR